jgi:hypothetical protein
VALFAGWSNYTFLLQPNTPSRGRHCDMSLSTITLPWPDRWPCLHQQACPLHLTFPHTRNLNFSAHKTHTKQSKNITENKQTARPDRACRVVSVTYPYGRNLGFLYRSRYFFLSNSSSVILTRLSGPRSRPTTSLKIW